MLRAFKKKDADASGFSGGEDEAVPILSYSALQGQGRVKTEVFPTIVSDLICA